MLGFRLFVRGHGSAVPTQDGAAFAHEVERIPDRLAEMLIAHLRTERDVLI